MSSIKEAGFSPTFNDPEIENHAAGNALSDSASQTTTSKVRTTDSEESKGNVETPRLQGKNVVVTGEFEEYSREQIEQLVVLNGGQLRKSVSFSYTRILFLFWYHCTSIIDTCSEVLLE